MHNNLITEPIHYDCIDFMMIENGILLFYCQQRKKIIYLKEL